MEEKKRTLIRVLFVIPSLDCGGAEKALVRVANHLDRRKFEVAVAVFRRGGRLESTLSRHIRLLSAPERGLLWPRAIRRALWLRRVLREYCPHVLIGFLWYANLMSSLAGRIFSRHPRVILVEQTALQRSLAGTVYSKIHWMLGRLLHRRAWAVVGISKGIVRELRRQYGVSSGVYVIPNPVDEEEIENALVNCKDIVPTKRRFTVVAVARLAAEKNLSLLLQALVRLPDVDAWIVGEGEERARLEAKCRELGLVERVRFWGFQPNPYAFMHAADVLVLSSNFEGFANVLAEALCVGTPVISTDCPFGPAEVLQEGECGKLVPCNDARSLSEAIRELRTNEDLRKRFIVAGKKRASDFSVKRITSRYEELIRDAMLGRRRSNEALDHN